MNKSFCVKLTALLFVLVTLTNTLAAENEPASDVRSIGAVLDAYHQAAAEANWGNYFDLMSDDGVFLGTDVSERWTKSVFQEYAENSNGWLYEPRERNINLTPDGNSAWFDEVLSSANYGTSRGTGVLIRTADGWKISQYHLTFPIPNPLAQAITDQIKSFEENQ